MTAYNWSDKATVSCHAERMVKAYGARASVKKPRTLTQLEVTAKAALSLLRPHAPHHVKAISLYIRRLKVKRKR